MTLEAKQEIHSPSSSYMLQEHNLQTYSSPLAYPSSVDINLVAYHSFFCIWTYIQWVNITNLVAHFIASSSIFGAFQQHPENHNHVFLLKDPFKEQNRLAVDPALLKGVSPFGFWQNRCGDDLPRNLLLGPARPLCSYALKTLKYVEISRDSYPYKMRMEQKWSTNESESHHPLVN